MNIWTADKERALLLTAENLARSHLINGHSDIPNYISLLPRFFPHSCDFSHLGYENDTNPDICYDSSEVDIEDQIREQINSMQQLPFCNYIYNRCHNPGHRIQHCPTKNPPEKFSPYQGDRRSEGLFHCSKCHLKWKSSNCFANTRYKCNNCQLLIYPHKMFPIRT